jgi:hypothetical protein
LITLINISQNTIISPRQKIELGKYNLSKNMDKIIGKGSSFIKVTIPENIQAHKKIQSTAFVSTGFISSSLKVKFSTILSRVLKR